MATSDANRPVQEECPRIRDQPPCAAVTFDTRHQETASHGVTSCASDGQGSTEPLPAVDPGSPPRTPTTHQTGTHRVAMGVRVGLHVISMGHSWERTSAL